MASSIFDTQEWIDAYERLKAKAAEFTANYAELESMSDVAAIDPDFAARRRKLLDRGDVLYSTIENIRSFANTVYGAFDNFQLGDLSSHIGLSAFWIPVTVVLGVISSLTIWVKNSVETLQEGRLIRDLQAEGYSLAEAIRMAREGKSELVELRKMLPWIIGGGVLLIMLPRLLR